MGLNRLYCIITLDYFRSMEGVKAIETLRIDEMYSTGSGQCDAALFFHVCSVNLPLLPMSHILCKNCNFNLVEWVVRALGHILPARHMA